MNTNSDLETAERASKDASRASDEACKLHCFTRKIFDDSATALERAILDLAREYGRGRDVSSELAQLFVAFDTYSIAKAASATTVHASIAACQRSFAAHERASTLGRLTPALRRARPPEAPSGEPVAAKGVLA